MAHITMVTTNKVPNMGLENTNGQMDPDMKEIGLTTKLKVKVSTFGKITEPMMAIGSTTICMVKVLTHGQMVENI